MNEKEYQEFNRKYTKLKREIKETPENKTPKVLWRIYLAITSYSPVIADIARQLTRLADQGDDTAKARDHSVEQMMSALAATPAPDVPTDALVEAVKEFIDNETLTSEFFKNVNQKTVEIGVENLTKLVDAHEQGDYNG